MSATANRPTTARDLLRLAAKADGLGLTLYRAKDGADEYVVPSSSRPGLLHQVTVRGGCSCEGYGRHGRCMHHALLLAELGLIEEEPEPTPPAPAAAALPLPACDEPAPWELPAERVSRLRARAERAAAAAERGFETLADRAAEAEDAAAEARGLEREAKREGDHENQRALWRAAARYWSYAAQCLSEAGEPERSDQAGRDGRRCQSLAAAAGASLHHLRATAEDNGGGAQRPAA